MSRQKKVLLLVGSAKRPRSTSESLGTYLLERLGERGFATEKLLLHQSLRTPEQNQALLAATDRTDVLVLASPLYVDSLPALVTRTLELLAEHRQGRNDSRRQQLLAIVNCGFPEAHQTHTALAICCCFARHAGFEWAGGLGLGGGEAINGQPLLSVKTMTRNVIRCLEVTADALAAGEPVPEKAVRLMAKPLVPTWIYTWLGERNWVRRAKKHGASGNLDARPFQA